MASKLHTFCYTCTTMKKMMKMKQKYTFALAMVLPLAATMSWNSLAQTQKTTLPKQQQHHMLKSDDSLHNDHYETLSGLNLHYTGKGTYQLDFSQQLKENAVLSIKNKEKQVVYQKPVSVENNTTSWRYKLGKLKPGTYLVEVITSDTTYWTKFKIGR